MSELDFPVATPCGIAPVVYRSMILQAMALQYFKAIVSSEEEFSWDDAMAAAVATWETEWADDPEPRTIDTGIEAVQADLAYWCED